MLLLYPEIDCQFSRSTISAILHFNIILLISAFGVYTLFTWCSISLEDFVPIPLSCKKERFLKQNFPTIYERSCDSLKTKFLNSIRSVLFSECSVVKYAEAKACGALKALWWCNCQREKPIEKKSSPISFSKLHWRKYMCQSISDNSSCIITGCSILKMTRNKCYMQNGKTSLMAVTFTDTMKIKQPKCFIRIYHILYNERTNKRHLLYSST